MNIIIAGGNATGMSAATRIRKNSPEANIIVLEKSDIVSFGACGLPYFVGDEFSDANEMIVRSIEAFQKSNIDVRLFHEIVSLDSKTQTVRARNTKTNEEISLSYDKLLISTGAHPFVPPIAGVELKGVHTLTKIEDGTAVKDSLKDVQNVVVIGGGFIGLEVAEAMIHQGKTVTLIEKGPGLSTRVFDPEMTKHLEVAILNSGVDLRRNEGLEAILGQDKVEAVKTDKGEYPADLVIIAIGFRPSTQWLKESGIEMLPNGAIVIDELCQTSLPHVYAGGDCATVKHAVHGQNSYIPLATTANKLGRLLGDTMSGKEAPFHGTLGSSALRFQEFEIARTGLSEHEAQSAGYDYATNVIKDYNHTSYVAGKTEVVLKYIYDKKTRVLLGAQICGGDGAALRIDALAVAIFTKMTVDTLGMMDFMYAPPFSRTWDIMNIAGNTAK
ncbi:MAG: CoA-disulfide reductase [Brevinema sp.]